MSWKPSVEPLGYDEARVDRLKPIEHAISALRLPPSRERKLDTILNALEMQIEDGGDHPEVNRLLLEALQAGVVHQVGEGRAHAVSAAIGVFLEAEEARWERVRAGDPAFTEVAPGTKIDRLIQQGYRALDNRDWPSVMDAWLPAWEVVKQLATPAMRTTDAFDHAYPHMVQCVFNWTGDLEMELHNAGIDNPVYHEHRIRYVDEFLALFPDEEEWRHIGMMCAKGEALFLLGRREEGEAVYRDIVARYPNAAWGYISWSEHYHYGEGVPVDTARAEEILTMALERPQLEDRDDALQRLATLYLESGQSEACKRIASQLPANRRRPILDDLGKLSPTDKEKLGRNDPCWCGSGKKYKNCHWQTDHAKQ